MRKYINYAIGLFLIVPGFFLLLDIMHLFKITDYIDFKYLFSNYWATIFFVLPGIFIHALYFAEEKPAAGFLISGSIMAGWGILLQVSYSFGLWKQIWPGFVTCVAIALFEIYWFGRRERGMLISSVLVTGFSAILFSKTLAGNFYTDYIIASVLIIIGCIMIFVKNHKREMDRKI